MLLAMKRVMIFAAITFLSSCCIAQESQDWGKLLDAKKDKEAETLCTTWMQSASIEQRVEAEKCLANVELYRGQIVQLIGNDAGGGTLGGGYTPEAVDKALVHLNRGIELAPQDLSVHQGRLHILEVSGRFDNMAKALDESASVYKGSDAVQAWLAYTFELGDDGQAKAALKLAEVLNKHYPNQHDVVGNMGAFHNMLKEWDKGLPYLQRAVALAPNDVIDNWNLGWAYAHMNRDAEADEWMSKAITLDRSEKEMPGCKCLYAEFVETHLKDRDRACRLEKANCEKDRQMACVRSSSSKK
jgi:tetratricopeptide (TPR) repeat protein